MAAHKDIVVAQTGPRLLYPQRMMVLYGCRHSNNIYKE
jgi:hypothetical protein